MMFGIAAAVLLVLGIGAYFALGGKSAAPVAPVTTMEETATPDESVVTTDAEAVTETEVTEEADTAAEATPAAEPTAEPAAAAVPAPAAAPALSNEFSDRLKDGSSGPEIVMIPAGSFDMGSSGSSGNAEERPRRSVTVKKFAISKYEITFTQYERFAAATGRKIPDNLYMEKNTHPVIFVNWDDAFYYAKWLSEQTGQTYSIPSESQWEYAAGAGNRASFWWGYEEEPNRAHCFGCGTGLDPRKPTKVGSFPPNKFGVFDTAGNVSEWVRDCWHDNYSNAPTSDEVWEGGDCITRVVRGGSYSSPPQSIRHAKRDRFKSDALYDNIGIRLVRVVN